MNQAEPRRTAREFNADDARAIARSIIEVGEGAHAHFSEGAADTLAAIILWEALKGGDDDGYFATLAARLRGTTKEAPQ